jgi:hypothetical protein
MDNDEYSNDESWGSCNDEPMSNIISHDSGRYVINMGRKNGKKQKKVVYTTNYTPGSIIRNAISGQYQTNFFVGKPDEFEFFKVSLSGHLGQKPQSKHLYYDSPQQYESHFEVTVASEIKEKWNSKRCTSLHGSDTWEVVESE